MLSVSSQFAARGILSSIGQQFPCRTDAPSMRQRCTHGALSLREHRAWRARSSPAARPTSCTVADATTAVIPLTQHLQRVHGAADDVGTGPATSRLGRQRRYWQRNADSDDARRSAPALPSRPVQASDWPSDEASAGSPPALRWPLRQLIRVCRSTPHRTLGERSSRGSRCPQAPPRDASSVCNAGGPLRR